MYIYIYIHMYIHMSIYVCICTCMYMCIYARLPLPARPPATFGRPRLPGKLLRSGKCAGLLDKM